MKVINNINEDRSTPPSDLPILVRVLNAYVETKYRDVDSKWQTFPFSLGITTYSYLDEKNGT